MAEPAFLESNRAVAVSWWATACQACVAEAPLGRAAGEA